MIDSRALRLFACCLFWLPSYALAVSSIEIHIGAIRHPAAHVDHVAATLDMDGRWQGSATLRQGDLAQLVQLAQQSSLPVTVSKGDVQGQASFAGTGTDLRQFKLEALLRDIAFSDADGQRAGEKLGGRIALVAQRLGERWQWQGNLNWMQGEAYWQPWYFANGGHTFQAGGWLSSDDVAVEQGELTLAEVGHVIFSGRMALTDKRITSLKARAEGLHAGSTYALLLKPLAIVTDNQKGRDNLSGLNMTWDICRIPELRETVLFMLSADYVEVAFLWGGGDCFIHKGDLVNPGKPVVDYLAG